MTTFDDELKRILELPNDPEATELVENCRAWAESLEAPGIADLPLAEVALISGDWLPDDLRKYATAIERLTQEREEARAEFRHRQFIATNLGIKLKRFEAVIAAAREVVRAHPGFIELAQALAALDPIDGQ